MQLIVNGQSQSADPGTTVAQLVVAISDRKTGIAVSLNNEVVPRSEWISTRLHDADRVDVVTATQGG